MIASTHPPADPRTREPLIDSYPARWSEMIGQWRADDATDRLWLCYTANYLLRTAGVRWAIDPRILDHRIGRQSRVDYANDLERLRLVVLTHAHGDHYDPQLITRLRDRPIEWIIPEHMRDKVIEETALPEQRIRTPRYLEPFETHGIRITPFEGRHWEVSDRGRTGIDSTGYLFEFNGRRLLLPGDTRVYDRSLLPDFGPVDLVLAHLWLGRGCAEMDEPPLLHPFCDFILALRPGRIILTHLHDLSRGPGDCWGTRHANMAIARWRRQAPEIEIVVPELGQATRL